MSRPRPRIVLVLILLAALVAAGLVLPPLFSHDDEAPESATASSSPSPDPADQLLAAGYDADPGTFSLPASSADTGPSVAATFDLDASAQRFDGTVGLSFEASDLASSLWGSDTSNLTTTLAALNHPVLRFGGNSVDRRMWWTSSGEPAPSWAEATVTPDDLDRVATTASAADASVILTLDLGHDDPTRAADMAAHARQSFGDRLIGVSIGNEPNGFHHPNQPQLTIRDSTWNTTAYQASLSDYSAAINASSPGIPFVGPGAYDAAWWRAFVASDVPDKAALTMHWYPLWDCTGPDTSIANPTIADLTSPELRQRARTMIGSADEVARAAGLPLWMEETGPTSCRGTNETSRTEAHALWTADYSLTAVETGASRIAFHSSLQACDGGAPTSPVCATGSYQNPGELIQGEPAFLALMQLVWIPAGEVLTPTVSDDGSVSVHAVEGDDGRLALVVVDMRDPARDATVASIRISAPTGLADGAPTQWQPSTGSVLGGSDLAASDPRLTALAPVDDTLASQQLSGDQPLALTTQAGSTTLLILDPVTANASPQSSH